MLQFHGMVFLLTIALVFFFVWHVPFDILMMKKESKPLTDYGIDASNLINAILGSFSLLLWIFWGLTSFLWYSGKNNIIYSLSILYSSDTEINIISFIGIIIVCIAVIIQAWARKERGVTAASWGLSEDIELVQSGPYKIIRHPNYLFYFLTSVGLFFSTFMWIFILTFPLMFGYINLISKEEELLKRHFGELYVEYQKRTWKLIPFIY